MQAIPRVAFGMYVVKIAGNLPAMKKMTILVANIDFLMRSLFTAAIVLLGSVTAMAQSGKATVEAKKRNLSGMYATAVPCHECDSNVFALELEANPGGNSGKYTITKTAYHDAYREIYYKKSGDWYVLPNIDEAKNDNILVIVLDMLGKLEQYPLFYVNDNGNLHELDQRNPERFPKEVIKLNDRYYVTKKGEKMISVDRGLMYKDLPLYHVYKKRSS